MRTDKNVSNTHAAEATHTTSDALGAAADRIDAGVHAAADATARGAHRAADKANDWRENGADAVSDLRDRGRDASENLRALVCDRPVQSLAIAAAAGWLIGQLLRRR